MLRLQRDATLSMNASLFLYGLLAFVVTAATAVLAKRVALQVGAVAVPKADRWHRTRIPLLGGTAIAPGVVLGAVLAGVTVREIWILLAGALALFVVGLVDDLRPLKPQSKLVAQIFVAALLAAFGLQLHLTAHPTLNVLITVVWIVGITNAINLLDNMDGLAAGIAGIAGAFRLALFVMDGDVHEATFTAAFVGAVLGFLLHNFNPASIFMGDAGSLFLGTLVAGLSLIGDWPYSRNAVSVLMFPVLMLLVPIFDTAFVSVVRTFAGRPISVGGRDHTSHRLVAQGLSEREAVLLLYLVAILSGAVAFGSYVYGLSHTVGVVILLAIGLGLLGVSLARVQVYPEGERSLPEGARFFSLIADFSYKRQVGTVVIDSLLIIAAYYSAYLLRFEQGFADQQPLLIKSLPLVLGCQLLALALFRTYQGVWRYTGLDDIVRLAQAGTVGVLASVLAVLFVYRFEGFSRAVFVLDFVLLLVFVGGARVFMRLLGEKLRPAQDTATRVLVYGAGDGGLMVLREMIGNRALNRRIVGLLDDDRTKHRTSVHGVPVFGGIEKLDDAIRRTEAMEVVLSSAKIGPERAREIAAICDALEVGVTRASLRFD